MVRDIFWTHSESIKLFNTFPTVLVMELIEELTSYRDIYGRLYKNQEKFAKIHDALVPSLTGIAPVSKWMSFPDMGHLVESAYDMVCVDLTRFGLSETFFPLHSRPPLDASSRIICIGNLRSRHFVQVFFETGVSYTGYFLSVDGTSYK